MRTTASIFIILIFVAFIHAQPSEFTYQGRLTDGVLPANGNYQMQFSLFRSLADPDQIGSTVTVSSVEVTQGVFTVRLTINVPDAFDGGARWLAIAVKRSADPDYTQLTPRQPLTATPYAIKSSNASTADLAEDSAKLGGRDASEFVFATAGPASPQSGNFSVSGTGTLGNLSVGNGTAGAPSVSFSGDSDTGLFRSAADTLDISTAGVSRIQIGPDGRIGIGTAPTAARLSVFDSNPTPGVGTGGSFAGGSIGISGFGNGATSTASSFGVLGSAGGSAGSRFGVGGFTNSETGVQAAFGVLGVSNGPATFNYGVYGSASGGVTNWAGYFDGNTFTGGSGIIRGINSDINAGVGLTLNDQPGWSMATVTGGQFQIFNDFLGQNAVWIQRADNNVGIGTTSPSGRLDVLGNINTSTQYNIGGNRVLISPGNGNLFAGFEAGTAITSGGSNAYFGTNAGRSSTVGNSNSFFGAGAGENSVTGSANSFFGVVAGQNSTGTNNSFFGAGSGRVSTGVNNAFYGYQSGMTNAGGQFNAFFGSGSGLVNTTGTFNSFFGAIAGSANVGGALNSFFGSEAGDSNVNGHSNSFFGRKAGDSNTDGSLNVFIGIAAGQSNTTGHYNTIVGSAGNVTIDNLLYASALGARSSVGTSDTIVLGKVAGNYDGVVRPADAVQIPGDLTVAGTLNLAGAFSANAINASTQFNIGGIRFASNAGGNNTFVGIGSGTANTGFRNSYFGTGAGSIQSSGNFNAYFGAFAGSNQVSGDSNAFFGDGAGFFHQTGGSNAFFGFGAGANNQNGIENAFFGTEAGNAAGNGQRNTAVGHFAGKTGVVNSLNSYFGAFAGGGDFPSFVTNSTAIGARAFVAESNSLVLGSINGVNGATDDTNVGIGTTEPATRLHVSGAGVVRTRINSDSNAGLALTLNNAPGWSLASANGGEFLIFNDAIVQSAFAIDAATNFVRINSLGAAGGSPLCRNASNQIAFCSSSGRYKKDVSDFSPGLSLINRLRPVSFVWRDDGKNDLGLVAEEVAKAEPLLVTYNDKGEVEGVKYDRVGVVLINVVKEQQAQIDRQQKQIDALKKLLCESKPGAAVCQEERK